jgi:hypothetical protein
MNLSKYIIRNSVVFTVHLASYPMGTGALSLGVKRPVREADHSPPSSAEVKLCLELYPTPPIRLLGVVLKLSTGTTLPLPHLLLLG